MIPQRIECPCCGTKFTQDGAGQTRCGECKLWQLEIDAGQTRCGTKFTQDDAGEPIDFGPSARNPARSLENYRRIARIPRRR